MDFKNARPQGQPAGAYNPLQVAQTIVPGRSVLAEDKADGGMFTATDPADIPDNSFVLLRNLRNTDGVGIDSRNGTVSHSPARPNAHKILLYYDYQENDGSHNYLRFTPTNINKRGAGVWTPIVPGVGGVLTGSSTDRFRAITIFGRCFFTNNGADKIQEINVLTNQYVALGNAPRYKYMTGFDGRILAAHQRDVIDNPVMIGWSAEAGVTGVGLDEWDPLVNETAGFSPLIDSPSDFNDFITGIFSFSNIAVVLREKSVWLGTKQPIPSNPFNFYSAFPGIGCDCPDSAQITVSGLTWADTRTRMVWHYSPGGAPEPLGMPISDILFSGMSDKEQVFSCYSPQTYEYFLCVPQSSTNIVLVYCYSFRTKQWTQLTFDGLTAANMLELGPVTLTIGELTGQIGQLTGTIGNLGHQGSNSVQIVWGRQDGMLLEEDVTILTDPIYPDGATAVAIQTEVLSKTFKIPRNDVYVVEFRLELIPLSAGTIEFSASKDGGLSFLTATKTLDFVDTQLGYPVLMKWVRTVKARRYTFRVRTTIGKYRLLGYEVHVERAGDSGGYGAAP